LAGPFLHKPDHFVLGSIIQDIARGGPIRIRADHPVVRSYVHVGDLVDLIVATLLDPEPVPVAAFDTAGEREIEVGELARLAASVLGHPEMPIERPPVDSGRSDRYVGDPAVMHQLARRAGIELKPLPAQIEDTARFMAG
jgi:nucleoside-diphosphate-sugar epimerase